MARIARIIGLDIKGCMARMYVWISSFAQQIGNQQTIQKQTFLVNSSLIHKLNIPRPSMSSMLTGGVIRDNLRF